MRNKIIKTIFLSLLTLQLFAQIGSKVQSAKPGLTGNWINKDFGYDMKLQLAENGKGIFEDENISYSIVGSKLSIKFEEETIAYNYKLAGNTLTLSGGDLDAPINFAKEGNTNSSTKTLNSNTPTEKTAIAEKGSKAEKLIGKWTTEGADIEFRSGGKGIYNGNPFTYTVSGNTLTSTDNTGSNVFFFMFLGEGLSLSGAGVNVVMQRGHGGYKAETNIANNNNSAANNSGGGIDPSIVGKWCWVKASGNTQASSSSSKCINIFGNGTYTYASEGSISGYGGGGYGGSSSQSADNGTWKIVGNKIHVNSRSQGFQVLSFEKRNHPKNGDPMIVIDGDTYVTYTQKPSWR